MRTALRESLQTEEIRRGPLHHNWRQEGNRYIREGMQTQLKKRGPTAYSHDPKGKKQEATATNKNTNLISEPRNKSS
jgi:hypothetical protein